ncbi:protein translocase subunit SecDF, partial [bacterium]|nr:protein translocase subunit SecDF [bacterium]
KVEANAASYAESYVANHPELDAYEARKTAKFEYLDSVSGEEIMSLPLLGSFTYEDLKSRQLNLGLDLKGGMSSVLRVNLKELLITLSGDNRDANFRAALDEADAAQRSSQSDFISLFGSAYGKKENAKPLASFFRKNATLGENINFETPNTEVIKLLRETADKTVQLTFERLKQRIDKLGVTQPNVSLDAARDLILVEMPGIENPERARNFLQASAALEFWDTYRNTDPSVANALSAADQRLKSGDAAAADKPIEYDTLYTPILDDDGNETGEQNMQILEKGGATANLGPLLSLLTLNNGATGDLVGANTVFGFADKNKRKAVIEMLERSDIKTLFPGDAKFMWGRKPFINNLGENTKKYSLYIIKKQNASSSKPVIEGDVITRASHGPNPVTGQVAVNLSMNNEGARKWGDMTTKAYNNGGREIAICIDNEVISAPGVNNGPILQGSTEITGNFSVQEASDFASLLEVGKLPAKIESIQEETVGPSLGEKNINSSLLALLIGFGLVLMFMVFYYAGAGIFSIIALLLNVFFIFGALASFGTVLTLPGIAGIILTIGMAVDANVIIFERIREELRAGKSSLAAISDGFKHSYSAIIDANVTTILVAIVLAYFGMGPIKGFAVVLIIGVLTSLFTAVLIGRMMIDSWTKGDRGLSFWNGMTKNSMANLNIDWIGKRKIAYVISSTFILVGIGSIFTKKFDLGVDFKGGYSYTMEFDQSLNVDAQTLRSGLAESFGAEPVVKAVDTQNSFNVVTTYLINDTGEDAAERAIAKLHEGISSITGTSVPLAAFKSTGSDAKVHVVSSSKVGPTIADDIKTSAFYAGIFALLILFIYIFIRFNKWQYSMGAVAALFHDSMIILGLFSVLWGVLPFSLEINQAFIAALLTVIAYSINDTVVVFDRIREYLGIYTQKDTDEILNLAINSTFSRTLITSLTTGIMLLPLFIFGGNGIKGFAFAILIGIVVGTYSSIFVATPIVRDLSKDLKNVKNAKAAQTGFSKAASKS